MKESIAVVWQEYTASDRDAAVRVPFAPDGFLNATAMAEAFGKRVYDWLRTDRAIDYIRAAHRRIFGGELPRPAENVRFAQELDSPLVVTRKGGLSGEQGTWLHPKVAIEFARWISPDFGVWCDGKIEEILRENGPYPLRAADESALVPVRPESQLLVALGDLLQAQATVRAEVADLKAAVMGQLGPDMAIVKDTTMETSRDVKDMAVVLSDVHLSTVKANGKRVYPDKDDASNALRTVQTKHGGMCPCCKRVRILDANGLKLPVCVWDHARQRDSGDPKKGWYVCEGCNKDLGPPNGNPKRKAKEHRFMSYQEDFCIVLEEIAAESRARRRQKEVEEVGSGFLFDVEAA